jgi:hypothetical protein
MSAVDLVAIQNKFEADVQLSGTLAGKDLYQRLADLTSEVGRLAKCCPDNKPTDETPVPDLVTNLQIEIANLKQRLAALSEMESIVEQTRTALRQREEANDANQTAARLPYYAAELMAELIHLKKG